MLVAAAALAVAGCGPQQASSTRLSVVTSIYPLFEFVQRVGGDRVDVHNLVPAGAESHDYEPTPRDLAAIERGALLVFNDAGLEPWVARVLPQLSDRHVTVNATEGLPLLSGVAGGEDGDEDGGQVAGRPGRGGIDPHVWLDPLLAQQQVERIVAGLLVADPPGRADYEANAARLKEELQMLHAQFESTLRRCRRKAFITSHAAFGYLARRYGLKQIAIGGLSPQAEPSPARLVDVVRLARRRGIKVIYHETLDSPRVAQTIALEVGASVRALNPLEGLTRAEERQGKNYFTVMYENLRNLAEGLDCR